MFNLKLSCYFKIQYKNNTLYNILFLHICHQDNCNCIEILFIGENYIIKYTTITLNNECNVFCFDSYSLKLKA